MIHLAYLGLGANLGDAASTLRYAATTIAQLSGVHRLQLSSLYRSAPVGYIDQPDFTNAVAAVETSLTPHALLVALQEIEQRFGRQRTFRNAPRTLDLDILLYGDLALDDGTLTIPHPRMTERAFVLVPLAEIAPDITLPNGKTILAQLAELDRTDLQGPF